MRLTMPGEKKEKKKRQDTESEYITLILFAIIALC